MKINKRYIAVGMIIAFTLLFELAAHADESDQATTITFNQPIQIPGQVLPAGTYSLKLLNNNSDQNVVQIFNSDQTHLYATLQTIAAERQEPTGDTVITLAEQGGGKPDALLKWFYPGLDTGHEFVYSGQQEKQLAQDTQQTIVANQSTNANSEMGAGN
jgi:Protein of unknown function (DUF2911)